MKDRLKRVATGSALAVAVALAVVASSCSATADVAAPEQASLPATTALVVDEAAESEFDWVDGEYIDSLLADSISPEWAGQLSDAEVQCVTNQVIDAGERGAGTPLTVAELMAEWCAPQRWAAWWAEADSDRSPRVLGKSLDSGTRIRIDDPEQRLCMATVVVEERVSGSVYDMVDLRLDGLDPFGVSRARIDARLADECGLDAAAGIAAGLRARIEVDSSDVAQIFCREFNRRSEASLDLRETVAGEITYNEFFADQNRAITAPPVIAAEWDRWIRALERKGELAAELNLAGDDLDRSPEWQAVSDELTFETARRIVFEYWKINC